MSADDELRSLEDYDRELEQLKAERERLARLLADPEQRKGRRVRRQQLLGRWAERLAFRAVHLDEVRELSGDEAWLFDPDILAADGWIEDEGAWRRES